jgi:heat shock protein HslJ
MVFLIGNGCKETNLKDAGLLNNKWILSFIQDTKTQAITNYPGDATGKISISFSGSSNDIGFNGLCNNGAGKYSYTSSTGEIKITDLATTLIYCKYVEWETYTVQNLYYASGYMINGNDLVIYSKGTYNLAFTKN